MICVMLPAHPPSFAAASLSLSLSLSLIPPSSFSLPAYDWGYPIKSWPCVIKLIICNKIRFLLATDIVTLIFGGCKQISHRAVAYVIGKEFYEQGPYIFDNFVDYEGIMG